MKRAEFLEPARLEYFAEIRYYNEKAPQLGIEFRDAVEDAIHNALAFPMSGTLYHQATRRALVKGFPFAILYEVIENGILIKALAHQSRKPGYWTSRE